MKTRTILLSFVLILMVPAISNAQIGSMLRNKVGKVVNAGAKTLNKEIDKEIDTAAQKEVDKVKVKANEDYEASQAAQGEAGENAPKEGAQPSKGINLGGLMGGKVTLKYENSYSFTGKMYMQMEMYDKKEVTKMDYYIYFSETSPNGGFESKIVGTTDDGDQVSMASNMVFDGTNKVVIMLTDMGTMKMGIISAVPEETATEGQPVENKPKSTVTKTGNSKVIAGYKCDEYLYKDNESKDYGKLWVTKDLKLKGDKRIYSKAGLPAYYGSSDLEGGAVLAMESYNEKNELQMKSETKEINMNFPHTISVSGYSLRQMNFNQAQGQQKK
jgi:hypothetical protein